MDGTGGLRERKKAATRQALYEAALRLAAELGTERVTVEAISDAANVSRRTFSNYFSSKEEVFFHGDRVRMRRLLSLVHERPTTEPPWTALTRAVGQLAAESDDIEPLWLAQRRLVRAHPSLAAQQLAVYGTIERELAAELGRRMPGVTDAPLRARVLAAALLTTLRAATQHWIDHPERPLAEVVGTALGYVRAD